MQQRKDLAERALLEDSLTALAKLVSAGAVLYDPGQNRTVVRSFEQTETEKRVAEN